MALADLALSRSRLDKVSDDRTAEGLLAALLQDPTTSLLPLRDGRVPVLTTEASAGTPDGSTTSGPRARAAPGLRTLRGEGAAALIEALGGAAAVAADGHDPSSSTVAVHLGRFPDDDPRAPGALVGLLLPSALPGLDERATATVSAALAAPDGGLRDLGAILPDTDAGALTEAVALEAWHRLAPRCPRCGGPTEVRAAGHERVCPADGSSHHPRHDPAVIMTVTDPAGRLLLGHARHWPPGRFSAFAGFVEPGESLEAAVSRELMEESGVTAREVTYLGSQPWPFPASIMLAFHVETDDTEAVPDGEEITEARWFDRQGLRDAVESGEITVPPEVSVARHLIERWLGGRLERHGTWR